MLPQLQIFLDYISKYDLFDKNETILLATSGGRDSMAMVYLFHLSGFKTAIAHCNFNLRGEESVRDEIFVKNTALKLNTPIHIAHFDTTNYAEEHKISIQMAARDLRYDFFEDLCAEFKYQKIAVAHHHNDSIETVLLNLIRGTGIAGLHGIKHSKNTIIRPLLCFTREEIDQFVSEQKIDFVEDSSNASDKYARNKIRLKIIPEMEKINPSLNQTFRKNINYFSELEDFVNHEMNKYKSDLLEPYTNGFKIGIKKIEALHSTKFILSEILLPLGFNTTSINDLLSAVQQRTISGKTFCSEDYRILLDREYIFIKKLLKKERQEKIEIPSGTETIHFNQFDLRISDLSKEEKPDFSNPNKCYVDSDKLTYPLSLRYWELADRFIPFGMKGFKKLSDFFIQQKTPLNEKAEIPILVNGNDEIIWISGLRSDNRYKIDNQTKKITTFEIKSR
ncbi:tRNA(Ile)-lysidine synthetase [Pseudopedobacter saltans DSM 12145]|uniref:tRNA(Ile)-lysidine synthase n=1 Tax=Pseudopedobacter saltans (strain ATCC 51119 / DSM 12145 / JCM 21818 / CCUG 39354 / LMG 10337 / NBRC 100064 / NCIMB 13643) TaxID=762903 RepID=F0SDI7_PSESL|nr:tRNA lysidine(34) synthetase TilS [Pseudopedobacter saltans]ADY53970.1 tRNA(Ile)-lysidine synthetase [Pseudopedobacter saltans DSM 12145]